MSFHRSIRLTGLSDNDPLPASYTEAVFTPGASEGGSIVIPADLQLAWYADTATINVDGNNVVTSTSPFSSVTGTPLLITDNITGGRAVRTKAADRLLTPASTVPFLATGPCTIHAVVRYRTNGTATRPIVFDSTQDGTQPGIQIQFGDVVDSIFYGRSIVVRQWDGSSWFDSSSTVVDPGAFIPLEWCVLTIRISSSLLDIRVGGQLVWAGGIAITKAYLMAAAGAFSMGGGAFDYKAVELYSAWRAIGAVTVTEASLATRFSAPLLTFIAGDPTLLGGPTVSASFPYISKLPNGHLYATVYMGIDGPTPADHNDAYVSLDNGDTWQFFRTETQSSSGLRYSDLKTSEPFSDGSIIQTTFTYDSSNTTQHHPIWRRSTDSAVTWTAWADANPGVTPDQAFVSQAPIEDPTQLGHLHMAVQTVETSGDTFFKIWDYTTSNAGATWARVLVANGITDSKKYAEPAMRTTASGEFRMLIRDATINGTSPMLQCHSAAGNHGVTWSSPTTTNLPAWSSGQQARILASLREVWIAREIGSSNKAAIFWREAGASADAAWQSAKLEIDPAWGGMYYAGIYEVSAGSLVLIYARSGNVSAGNNNNVGIRHFKEYILDFALPGDATPHTATVTAGQTQAIALSGAGDYTRVIDSDASGGATVVVTGERAVFTAGPSNGAVAFHFVDINSKTTQACTYTVTGGTSGANVTSILPDAGLEGGSTAVTITGTGFTGSSGATIGGVALTSFVVVNATTITGVTGVHAIGNVNVIVTNGGTSTLTNGFTYLPTGATLLLTAGVGETVSGSDIQVWADQSGHGNNAAPLSFSPTVATGMNSKRVVRFVNAEALDFASFTGGLTAADVFILAQNADDTSTAAVMAFTDDTQQNFTPLAGSRLCYDGCASTTRQTTGFAPAAGGWSSPWLIEELGTASEWTFSFNGTQQYTQASNTFGYGTRHIGKGVGNDYVGDIGAVWIWPRKLSTPERAVVVAYLKTRGGIP